MKKTETKLYDLIGIGIGPFNLGLAALLQETTLNGIFFDRKPSFNWHPGILLDWARMQVPFYADLVTLENPCSPYSYLNYLKCTEGLLRHATLENLHPLRSEFNTYYQWTASRLPNLHFNHMCESISYDPQKKLYKVIVRHAEQAGTNLFYTDNLVIGVGLQPFVPFKISFTDNIFHSSDYLHRKKELKAGKKILVVGSGQSAAEIVYDLMLEHGSSCNIQWITQSERLTPMEEGPFAYNLSSPRYIEWFYAQPISTRNQILSRQSALYKGISAALLRDIYLKMDEFNRISVGAVNLKTGLSMHDYQQMTQGIVATFNARFEHRRIKYEADYIILGTGYKFKVPESISGIMDMVQLDEYGYPILNKDYSCEGVNSLYFQNADLHSHGFNSADLGLGPYRSRSILNSIVQRKATLAVQEY